MTKFSKGFQCALYVFLLSYALSGAIAAISDAPIGLPVAICGSIAAFFGLIAPFKAGKYSIFIALAFFAGFCLWRYDTTVELVRAIVAWFSGDAYIVDIMRLDLVLYICPICGIAALICYRTQGGGIYAFLLTLIVFALLWSLEYLESVYVLIAGVALMLRFAGASPDIEENDPRRTIPWLISLMVVVAVAGGAYALSENIDLSREDDPFQALREWADEALFFTTDRYIFSLANTGYQPLVSRLGGPISPKDTPVMDVRADKPVLLAGRYKNAYLGDRWEDTLAERRYRYNSILNGGPKDEVFTQRNAENLPDIPVSRVSVEYLTEGPSTLFAPNRLESVDALDMGYPYFNESGELFATRALMPGSAYAVSSRIVYAHDPRMIDALQNSPEISDPYYIGALESYTQVPNNTMLADIAAHITQNADTPLEQAFAIEYYLKRNYAYTMDVPPPPRDMDFTEYFLFREGQGYCTYFATAFAVLCRYSGLPTRYIEGYAAYPDENGVAHVRAKDAHAWVEVYFAGFGWVTFDPTPSGDGDPMQDNLENAESPEPTDEETSAPSTPPPTEILTDMPPETPEGGDDSRTAPPSESVGNDTPSETPYIPPFLGWMVGAAAGVIALITLLVIVLRRRRFLVRVKRMDADKALRCAYLEILYWLNACGLEIRRADTPHAIAAAADARFALENRLSRFINRYGRSVYGGKAAKSRDVALFLAYYADIRNYARRNMGWRYNFTALKRIFRYER